MPTAQMAFEVAQALYAQSIHGLKELRWEDVPEPVCKYIKEHSTLSALHLASLLALTCPGLVVTPVLGWIGFSSIGPVAGSFASWYQATFGATWIFSGMQSAAMAGYAANAANGAVQGAAIIGGGVAHWFKA